MPATILIHPAARCTIGAGSPVTIESGAIELDEQNVPYASATVILPLPTTTGDLDPRDDVRVLVEGTTDGADVITPPTYTSWTTERTNYVQSPSFGGGSLTGWGNYWGPARALVSELAPFDDSNGTVCRYTKTTDTHTGLGALTSTVPRAAVGTTYRGIFRVKAAPGATVVAGFRVNSDGAANAVTVPADGAWHELVVTRVEDAADPGTYGIGLQVNCTNSQTLPNPTEMFWIDSASLEFFAPGVPASGGYFDGGFPAPSDLDQFAWSGAANASYSVYQTRDVDVPQSAVWAPSGWRPFDLGMRDRTIDHVAKTVTISLGSDEALLMDYATLTRDTGARAHEGSLRDVVDYVLEKIGASLEVGGPDADVTAAWELTNAVQNAICDTTSYYFPSTNASGLAAESTPLPPVLGSGYLLFRATAAGQALLRVGGDLSVSPGEQVIGSAYLNSPHNVTANVYVQFLDNEGATISRIHGATLALSGGTTWVRASAAATAPLTAVKAQLVIRLTAPAANNALRFEAPMLTTGTELVDAFSGASPANSRYTYRWEGDPNVSASTRVPVLERLPELFVWKPGTTGWDFLRPFLSAAGFRLFCDELRVWRMIAPGDYVLPGLVRMTPANSERGTDTISREDPEIFATGVVVRYLWDDDQGRPQTAYDAAGDPSKVVVRDYARPYPGPGAAAAILARLNGSGRTQDVTALTQWGTSPGMAASITLPETPEQQGRVSSVRFELADTPVMRVGTVGLVEIRPGTIDALTGTIDALVGTIDALNPTI